MKPAIYSLGAFKLALIVARILPRPLAQRLAAAIAVWVRPPDGCSALRENLRAITGLEGGELDALCTANRRHFAQMLADYFLCAGSHRANGLLHDWRGIEHVEAARALGRGVLLVTAHLGHWELGGLLLAGHGLPMTVVTLEEPTTELTRWRDAYRRRAGIRTIPVGPGHHFAFVEIMQALRRNEVVAMLVDRPYAGSGEKVQFFGRATEFSTGPSILCQHTGAAVVPAFVLRDASGCYTAFAEAVLPLAPEAGLPHNTQLIASHFENIIRKHPEQWFNYVPIWRGGS